MSESRSDHRPAVRAGPMHARRGRRPPRDRFRPDIEGLRAVAVLGVVLFHAGVGALSGGFAGVDVFYVISGFLITDHLWRELDGSGRLSFLSFYARRARRLLPAAMVVLVVTMAVSAAVLPPLQVRSVWKDGLYSALYVGNFRFAATQTNYLADTIPSPFQHFWSLGVEEQFYLVWPVLLVAAALIWWRRHPSRTVAVTTLTVVCTASLALSISLTRTDQPVAFFLLPSRAWELGLGGIVALTAPTLRRLPVAVAAGLGWAGLAAIAASFFAYGAHTAYPGSAALLPVVGSAAVIAAGLASPGGGPVLFLGRPGMRAVGRISYSWYLWHYPVLVLAPYIAGHALSEPAQLGLAAFSGLLAVLSFGFVENPARRAAWLASSPTRSLRAGLAVSGAGVIACLGAAVTIPSVAGHGEAPVASIHQVSAPAGGHLASTGQTAPAGHSATAGRDVTGQAGSGQAGSVPDPARSALHAARAQVEQAVTASAATRAVPANLDPSLASASASEAAPMVDGCLVSFTSETVPECLFGDTTATRSIVLFGDSHASMWFPAVDAYANAHGYRLYVWTKAACPPVAITLFSPVLARTWTECRAWYGNVLAEVARTRPALTVLGIAPNYDSAYDVTQNGPSWQAGLASTVSALRGDGSRVLVMGSAPSPPQSIPDCLSANLDDVPACDFPTPGRRIGGGGLEGVDLAGQAAEAATVARTGGTFADVVPWFCTSAVCDTVVDNLLVYRDNSHITVPYAQYLAPLVADEIALTGLPG